MIAQGSCIFVMPVIDSLGSFWVEKKNDIQMIFTNVNNDLYISAAQ